MKDTTIRNDLEEKFSNVASVETDAGKVEYKSASDVIKQEEYIERKESGRKGASRVRFSVNFFRQL